MIKKSGFWVNPRPDFESEGSGAGRVWLSCGQVFSDRVSEGGQNSRSSRVSNFRVFWPRALGFWVNTRPDFEPEGSGSGRVGFDFPGVGFFRLGSPMGAKMVGRIGFQIFEFFDHPSIYHVLSSFDDFYYIGIYVSYLRFSWIEWTNKWWNQCTSLL